MLVTDIGGDDDDTHTGAIAEAIDIDDEDDREDDIDGQYSAEI